MTREQHQRLEAMIEAHRLDDEFNKIMGVDHKWETKYCSICGAVAYINGRLIQPADRCSAHWGKKWKRKNLYE